MSNLAVTYGDLGRHADALALREQALEFQRRVLPWDHLFIGEVDRMRRFAWVHCDAFGIPGTAMCNLAASFHALGRHADALALWEKVLEFHRRVLPEDHPDIGEVDGM